MIQVISCRDSQQCTDEKQILPTSRQVTLNPLVAGTAPNLALLPLLTRLASKLVNLASQQHPQDKTHTYLYGGWCFGDRTTDGFGLERTFKII